MTVSDYSTPILTMCVEHTKVCLEHQWFTEFDHDCERQGHGFKFVYMPMIVETHGGIRCTQRNYDSLGGVVLYGSRSGAYAYIKRAGSALESKRTGPMNPNNTLLNIRQLRALIHSDEVSADQLVSMAGELADLIDSLDSWITGGGFLPSDWEEIKTSP